MKCHKWMQIGLMHIGFSWLAKSYDVEAEKT